MSRQHLEKFLKERPYLIPVKENKDEKVLRWAEENYFISFIRFENVEFFTKEMLDISLMWKEKYLDGTPID